MAGIVWNKSAYILFAKFGSPKIYLKCGPLFHMAGTSPEYIEYTRETIFVR
jgi:hypothetical protein